MPVEHGVGEVGGAVADDGNRADAVLRRASVLGPHVLGLGLLQLAPAGRTGKDGVRGVRMHMDVQDVADHRDDERPAERRQRRSDLVGRRQLLAPDHHLGAVLEVPLRRDLGSAAGEKS